MGEPTRSFEEAWLPGPDGLAFYTRTYPAVGPSPKGAIIFVHGFADHLERHEDDNKAWAEAGFTLFGYDGRGFGRTALDEANKSIDSMYGKTSTQQTFQDLAWWIEHVSNLFPEIPLFVLGYSAVRVICCSVRLTAIDRRTGWRLRAGLLHEASVCHPCREALGNHSSRPSSPIDIPSTHAEGLGSQGGQSNSAMDDNSCADARRGE